MSFRSDITINWELSPRIITVLAPSATVAMQDLYDTIRTLEPAAPNMDDDYIISGSGKEVLGPGVLVGLTLTLNNALLAFEARPPSTFIQCKADGGNLVAIDASGNTFSTPIYPTAYTQVVLTSSSSATLSDLSAIQYSSYQNAVWYDDTTPTSGIEYPSGTRQYPVNNITDAIDIANLKGFDTIQLMIDISIDAGSQLNNFQLIGKSQVYTNVHIYDSAHVENIRIEKCNISGILDGGVTIENCIAGDLIYVNGHIMNSGLFGYIMLDGSIDAIISNCYNIDILNFPVIDMGGGGQNLDVPNYSGKITITNITNGVYVSIGMNSGMITLDASISAGYIIISGIGTCINNTTGTAYVDTDGLMSKDTVSQAIWDTSTLEHIIPGTFGKILRDTPKDTVKKILPFLFAK